MPRGLEGYHRAWLSAHPERSEEWLVDRLADGFDIHHLDGNHSNNDPSNLVLIDGADHLALHNGGKRISRINNLLKSNKVKAAASFELGKIAYDSFTPETGWSGVAQKLGLSWFRGDRALVLAHRYAKATGAKWPINNKKRPDRIRRRPLGHHIESNDIA